MVPGPYCTEDTRRCLNGIAHAARLVSAGHYVDVHCRTAEQLHARACLFGGSGSPDGFCILGLDGSPGDVSENHVT